MRPISINGKSSWMVLLAALMRYAHSLCLIMRISFGLASPFGAFRRQLIDDKWFFLLLLTRLVLSNFHSYPNKRESRLVDAFLQI